ncbi:hypothetical protein AMTRI_Chr03g146490 [Amborella trichopoda]
MQDNVDGHSLAIIEHFRKAFTTEVCATPCMNRIPFKPLPKDDVAQLEIEVSMDELKATVFSLAGDKAPGPDGFPMCFFQRFWSMLSMELPAMCFSLTISNVVNRGNFVGFQVGQNGAIISHLQYVDDTLNFTEAKKEYIEYIGRFMRCCKVTLGLKVNITKTSLVGVNCSGSLAEELSMTLGCKVEKFLIMYLGLPIYDSRFPISVWDRVIQRAQTKLDLWKTNYLSLGGRVTLVKSCFINLPIYQMSHLKMPASVIKKTEKMMHSYLWGSFEENRKYHLLR